MSEPIPQAAVIPIRDGQVCLITSRSGKRWVFPKGMIDPGHTPGEAALIEAWEEAGLVGAIDADSLGRYSYEKYELNHHVLVFRMAVSEAHAAWPEQAFRQRIWVTVEEAIERVDEPDLQDILRRLIGAGAV
jgi:8-oxo-dGTP pyrophosphatase MutT (NUDIX family)